MEELLINAAQNIGVPALLAFYIFFRVNVALEKPTKAIYKLSTDIDTRLK